MSEIRNNPFSFLKIPQAKKKVSDENLAKSPAPEEKAEGTLISGNSVFHVAEGLYGRLQVQLDRNLVDIKNTPVSGGPATINNGNDLVNQNDPLTNMNDPLSQFGFNDHDPGSLKPGSSSWQDALSNFTGMPNLKDTQGKLSSFGDLFNGHDQFNPARWLSQDATSAGDIASSLLGNEADGPGIDDAQKGARGHGHRSHAERQIDNNFLGNPTSDTRTGTNHGGTTFSGIVVVDNDRHTQHSSDYTQDGAVHTHTTFGDDRNDGWGESFRDVNQRTGEVTTYNNRDHTVTTTRPDGTTTSRTIEHVDAPAPPPGHTADSNSPGPDDGKDDPNGRQASATYGESGIIEGGRVVGFGGEGDPTTSSGEAASATYDEPGVVGFGGPGGVNPAASSGSESAAPLQDEQGSAGSATGGVVSGLRGRGGATAPTYDAGGLGTPEPQGNG